MECSFKFGNSAYKYSRISLIETLEEYPVSFVLRHCAAKPFCLINSAVESIISGNSLVKDGCPPIPFLDLISGLSLIIYGFLPTEALLQLYLEIINTIRHPKCMKTHGGL